MYCVRWADGYFPVIMCEYSGLAIQAKQTITRLSLVGFPRPIQTYTQSPP